MTQKRHLDSFFSLCVCVVFLVLRPLQCYFTILRVKANIVKQITQRKHLESKSGMKRYLSFFCGFTTHSGLFHYFKGKKKYCSANKQKRHIESKNGMKI